MSSPSATSSNSVTSPSAASSSSSATSPSTIASSISRKPSRTVPIPVPKIVGTTTTASESKGGSKGGSKSSKGNAGRKRKTHRKSRLGCTNCKIRSVKCDESKPSCGRCDSSGFTCTYSTAAPALQLAYSGVFKLDLGKPAPAPFINTNIPLALPVGNKIGTYEMRPYEIAAVDRYLNRTAHGFRAEDKTYQKAISIDMANAHPFLIHIFTAFSLLHDIYLSDSPPTTWRSQAAPMSFHWYHAAALFKNKLSSYCAAPNVPVAATERDALWMCSALLTVGSFANLDSFDPLESWPLKADDPMDLGWIKMEQGTKNIVWNITDPSRPESHYHSLYKYMGESNMPTGHAPIRPHGIPARFFPVFNINSDSNADNNPYHAPVAVLSQILTDEVTFRNGLRFFTFTNQMRPVFFRLLQSKDPRALLLLLYWYSKLVEFPWWFIRPRPIVEGVAICLYLQKYHSDDDDIIALIKEPQEKLFREFNETRWGNTRSLEYRIEEFTP